MFHFECLLGLKRVINRLNSDVASGKPTFDTFHKKYDTEVTGPWEEYINNLFRKCGSV